MAGNARQHRAQSHRVPGQHAIERPMGAGRWCGHGGRAREGLVARWSLGGTPQRVDKPDSRERRLQRC
jgi:hypothetical protein